MWILEPLNLQINEEKYSVSAKSPWQDTANETWPLFFLTRNYNKEQIQCQMAAFCIQNSFSDPVFHKSGLGKNVNLIFNIFYAPHESKQYLGSWPTKPLQLLLFTFTVITAPVAVYLTLSLCLSPPQSLRDTGLPSQILTVGEILECLGKKEINYWRLISHPVGRVGHESWQKGI